MITHRKLILVLFILNVSESEHKKRVRRYLAFPEGAVFSVVYCLTNLMGLAGNDIFSLNINWGMIYELPNDTRPLFDMYKPAARRRNRREVYGRLEKILSSMGYNGRLCLLRTLCEAERKLLDHDDNLYLKILALIFKFPQDRLLASEPDDHRIYHFASNFLENCETTFKCPFSLVDIALGYYYSN